MTREGVNEREMDIIQNAFRREMDDLKNYLKTQDDYHKERTISLCAKLTSHINDSTDYKKKQDVIIDKLFDITKNNAICITSLKTGVEDHLKDHDKKDREQLVKSTIGGGAMGSLIGLVALLHDRLKIF